MIKIEEIKSGLKDNGYIPNDDICYSVFQAIALNKPILIEGEPGVGKTSLAIAVSKMLGIPLIRLQMYDGLTKDEILFDYDYQKQLLTLEAVKPKINEQIANLDINESIKKTVSDVNFYGKEFILPRPVLKTIDGTGKKLLLIDEIDKSSEEAEYMLYEYLENYSVSIPQYGTIKCPDDQKPIVFLTSNGYRELSGAMRRRCGYLFIKRKTRNEIVEILKNNAAVNEKVAAGIARCIVELQERDLKHPVSISEAVDMANFIGNNATKEHVMHSIGLLAKDQKDIKVIEETIAAYAEELSV